MRKRQDASSTLAQRELGKIITASCAGALKNHFAVHHFARTLWLRFIVVQSVPVRFTQKIQRKGAENAEFLNGKRMLCGSARNT